MGMVVAPGRFGGGGGGGSEATLVAALMALSPWLYFKFDETNTGSSTIVDSSGHGRDATGSGAKKNQAPLLAGFGPSYGNASGLTEVDNTAGDFVDGDPISCVTLVNDASLAANATLFHLGNYFTAGGQGVRIAIESTGALYGEAYTGSYQGVTSAAGLVSASTTYMVGFSINPLNGLLKLYLNGLVVAQLGLADFVKITASNKVRFGSGTGVSELLQGFLQHGAIYKARISAQDFNDLAADAGLIAGSTVTSLDQHLCARLGFEGTVGSTSIVDDVGALSWTASGGAVLENTQVAVGSSALDLTTNGSKLQSSTGIACTFGTGDFSIKWKQYIVAFNGSGVNLIMDCRPGGTNGWYPELELYSNGSLAYYGNATLSFSTAAGVCSTGIWQDMEFKRVSGTTSLLVGGVSVGSFADTNNYPPTGLMFGKFYFSTAYPMNGYLDALQVTKG